MIIDEKRCVKVYKGPIGVVREHMYQTFLIAKFQFDKMNLTLLAIMELVFSEKLY